MRAPDLTDPAMCMSPPLPPTGPRVYNQLNPPPGASTPSSLPCLRIFELIFSAFLLDMSKSSWIRTALSFPWPEASSTSAY